MRLQNTILRCPQQMEGTRLSALATAFAEQLDQYAYPLRFSIVGKSGSELTIEAAVLRFEPHSPYADRLRVREILLPRRKMFQAQPFAIVQVVPTGVRCEFGGYAGDACPATNLLAATVPFLITHPNAVNASELNEMAANVLYVEGKALDDFLLGHIGLLPTGANKIGTFVDPTGIDFLDDVVHTLNAARAAAGIDANLYTVLSCEIGVRIEWMESGCATGTVLHPEAILKGVEVLLAAGTQAVGGVSVIQGVTADMFAKHLRGEIPNPSGAVEALITHLISKVFRVPCAHSPLPYYQKLKKGNTSNPRASAEFISTPHYFCVLKGLSKAPQLVELEGLDAPPSHVITLNNVGAIVVPADCLGGMPALAGEYSRIPVIAVRENHTVLNVTNGLMRMPNVIEASSYFEAAGMVTALRQGISLESLRRPVEICRRL